MSKLRCHISISVDGFVAGPNQSEENPLGEGGERLHDWVVPLAAWRQSHDKQGGEVNESTRIVEESAQNVGASVMGRNMFGPIGGGPWGDEQWTGWWGDDPPYHHSVFILTHHPRDRVEMEGGTTFHFVTDGIESALEQAKEAAGGKDGVRSRSRSRSSMGWTRRPLQSTPRTTSAGRPTRDTARAMSQENVEVVKAAYEAFARGGLDRFMEHFADDVDYRAVEGAPDDSGLIQGTDAVRAWLQDWIDTFDEFWFEPIELIDAGEDTVVAIERFGGRAKLSGVETAQTEAVAYSIRGGKLARCREYATRHEALESARRSIAWDEKR